MDALDLLKTSDVELLHRADACLRQAGSAIDTPPHLIDDAVRLRLFLEAHSYLSEILRRRAVKEAAHDKALEHRRFLIELLVIGGLIVAEIVLSLVGLSEGRQQAAILKQMNKNTQDTAAQIQRAADAVTASLEILRQERAERAKKPRLALYLGNTPIDSASVHLKLTGSSDDTASLDLLLKNGGDAPVSPSRLHALTPEGVWLQNPINTGVVRQVEPEANGFTVQLPLLPAGQKVRVFMQLQVPHGHATFKIPFTVDAMELQSVAPLGSLTVLPPKP